MVEVIPMDRGNPDHVAAVAQVLLNPVREAEADLRAALFGAAVTPEARAYLLPFVKTFSQAARDAVAAAVR